MEGHVKDKSICYRGLTVPPRNEWRVSLWGLVFYIIYTEIKNQDMKQVLEF